MKKTTFILSLKVDEIRRKTNESKSKLDFTFIGTFIHSKEELQEILFKWYSFRTSLNPCLNIE
jgi:hypothetical protein